MAEPQPWLGDACSLVEAFRAGEVAPVEALEASLGAIERSSLNAFSFVAAEEARKAAAGADVSLPFGGVPVGVKELDAVAGWPYTQASLVFRDDVAKYDATVIQRLRTAGVVPVGLTAASEFGGINCTSTRLNGTTGNPWRVDRTPGGSSGGSAAAVAGGLVPLATGADGGGSIRIPSAFCGLFGLKATFGRIPKGPWTEIVPLTTVFGCLARSVRDTARWFDVCNGFDGRDPYSLPRVEGWEAGLGTNRPALAGRRAAVSVDLGSAVVHPDVQKVVVAAAEALAADAGLELVDAPIRLPEGGLEWALAGLVSLRALLDDRYPAREEELTREIRFGLTIAEQVYNLDQAGAVERYRQRLNEAMADVFDQVDFVLCATNPDVAFDAEGPMPMQVGDRPVGPANNGALTIPANITGNPAVSIPAGAVDGLPVGLQVIGRHHEEPLLLELGVIAERERPWPLVAPNAPC